MRIEPLNDETLKLIKNAQTGKDAFEQLVRLYRHDVFRIIRVYTQNDSDAEDLSQETWIKVYQSLGNLKKLNRFESWLFTIAVNTAKNWLKSRAYRESQATDEMQPQQLWGSAVIQYQRQQLIEEIRDAIDSLSAKNREVVLDFYILGYSAAQISQQLNIPQSTVTGRLQEARKQLRKEFETMVAQSAIREKFAPDSLVRNVMDRVASLPMPTPTRNIIQRIVRVPQSTILTIGITTLIAFTVVGLIISNFQSNDLGNQNEKSDLGARILRNQVNAPIPPMNAPAQTPQQGQITFASDRDGNDDIYVMDADGKNTRRLTNNPAFDGLPAGSPDGQRIAFASDRDGNGEIYVMDAEGKNPRNLTSNPAFDGLPAWSPDGRKIAFHSDREGNFEVYVMDADGKNPRNLTNNPAGDGWPAWSPDGRRIAFFSERDGNFEIYVMDADGNNQRNLTNNPAREDSLSWSPDGQQIAFGSDRDDRGGNFEIYVMDVDGKNQTNLTNNPAGDGGPAWSPDGQSLVFTSGRDGNFEIYVMDTDGNNQRNLTNNPANDRQPNWFGSAFAVSFPTDKLRAIWGWLKLNSK